MSQTEPQMRDSYTEGQDTEGTPEHQTTTYGNGVTTSQYYHP